MTCIVGFVEDDKVYIGGDSAGVAGYDMQLRADKKVFKKNDMIFGFTSSFRMGQILRYCFNIPDHDPRKDDFDYLCSDFIDALIECFKSKGYASVSSNEVSGGTFLLGYKGKLYEIQGDFQVSEVLYSFNACGCGASYALGAMKMCEDVDLAPENRVEKALQAAEFFSAGVSAPFTVVDI